MTESVVQHFGEVYWSDYFKSRIVVVRYEDDDNWAFVSEKNPTAILKARTKLSGLRKAS